MSAPFSAKNEVSNPNGSDDEAPKAIMKPIRANTIAENVKSRRFFWATLTEFLERTKPASSSMKPICIKSTSPAATISQTISSPVLTSEIVAPDASARSVINDNKRAAANAVSFEALVII